MQEEDRVFLREFASKICYAHPLAAFALHRAAVESDEMGIVAESFMHLVDRREAEEMATDNRTAALVQTFVVARLLAQLAAAIEDCAALGDAIRFRSRGGLFARYLASKSAVAGDFFDEARRDSSLHKLLVIPDLTSLTVEGKERAALEHDYEHLPQALLQVADIYRCEGVSRAWTSDRDEEGSLSDEVNIVIDLVAAGSPIPRVTLLEAYNKIKHRFAVFDDIRPLGSAARAAGKAVVYATYPRDPDHAQRLIQNTATVARASGEMAALILKLDQLGAV
jgi:hypothetical protein